MTLEIFNSPKQFWKELFSLYPQPVNVQGYPFKQDFNYFLSLEQLQTDLCSDVAAFVNLN